MGRSRPPGVVLVEALVNAEEETEPGEVESRQLDVRIGDVLDQPREAELA